MMLISSVSAQWFVPNFHTHERGEKFLNVSVGPCTQVHSKGTVDAVNPELKMFGWASLTHITARVNKRNCKNRYVKRDRSDHMMVWVLTGDSMFCASC